MALRNASGTAFKNRRVSRIPVEGFLSVKIRIIRENITIVVHPMQKLFPETAGTHMQHKRCSAGKLLAVRNKARIARNIRVHSHAVARFRC